jgi:DNA-binding transcriptional regulator PaaX
VAADTVQDIFDGGRLIKILSAIGVVSGPIRTAVSRYLRGGEFGKQGTGKHSTRGFEKFPFIHVTLLHLQVT